MIVPLVPEEMPFQECRSTVPCRFTTNVQLVILALCLLVSRASASRQIDVLIDLTGADGARAPQGQAKRSRCSPQAERAGPELARRRKRRI